MPPEKPYGSLEALLKAEIGVDVQESVAIVKTRARAAKALTKHGELGRGRNRGNNITSKVRGDHVEYLTARIARDRPDILERMKAGEFSSVRKIKRPLI